MSLKPLTAGIALLCDDRGVIQSVIRDSIGLEGLKVGQPLGQLVESGSRIKLLNFLLELRTKRAAFDWEINIINGDQVKTLRLAGAIGEDSLIIVGAHTSYDVLSLCDELMNINKDLAIALRSAIKDHGQTTLIQSEGNGVIIDDISRLNNDLITLHRDLAKKNAELERLHAEVLQLALTDALTGLNNRRGLFGKGDQEIDHAKRYTRPIAAIMVDIDNFKTINDTHGHAIGDQALKEITDRCCRQLRKVDIFGRTGGDEFAILLPETQLASAQNLAERLRRTAGLPIIIGQITLSLSISLGVAVLKDPINNLSELLERADQALYKAKGSGGNCIWLDEG